MTTTYAADDLAQATRLARDMVTQLGMSDVLGPIAYGRRPELDFLGIDEEERDYGETTARLIDSEVRRLLDEAHCRVQVLSTEHRSALERLACKLLEAETLSGAEAIALIVAETASRPLSKATYALRHHRCQPGSSTCSPTRALALPQPAQTEYPGAMNTTSSRLAFLATISALHAEPLTYDLACLRALIVQLEPDLLCAEITQAMWDNDSLSQAALEVREALAPVVAATNVVLVPVAPTPDRFEDFTAQSGWRRPLVRSFERALRWGQCAADRPEAVNGPWFEAFCHTLCALTEMTMTGDERRTWDAQNQAIAANILEAVRRDPGRRVLAAVQCQRIHKLEPRLKPHTDLLELVNYWEL